MEIGCALRNGNGINKIVDIAQGEGRSGTGIRVPISVLPQTPCPGFKHSGISCYYLWRGRRHYPVERPELMSSDSGE